MKTSNNYYDALIASYTNTIFESGLLLDEDLQIILNYYKPDHQATFPEYKPCLGLKLSLSTLLGSLFLVKKVNKAFLLPPIVATGIAAIFEIKNYRKRKFQQLLMQDVVNISKKISSLNCSIRKYVKTRIEIEVKSQRSNLFTGYTKQIDVFFKDMLLCEIIFFETLIKAIEITVDISDELTDDFNSFKHFQPLTDSIPISNLQSGLEFLNKIHDLHVWLTSKLFSYLSIMFFSPNKQFTEQVYDKLLNIHLGSLMDFLKQHYDTTRKRFYTLKNSVAKLNEIKVKKPEARITNKLHKTLLSAIDNLSLITEKSHTIMNELENSEYRPSETLQTAIIDLRYHAFAAYESIDLLCRLYGILSSKQIPPDISKPIPQKERHTQDFTLASIHHDDLIDVPEENFELYLEKDYDNAVNETNTYQDDSGAYLSLMLQELKQSLGKHERFIEAKKRRGSVDTEVAIEKNKIEIPSFDLNVLKSDATDVSDCKALEHTNIDKTILSSSITSCPLPPPLPEDIKMFNVQDLRTEELHPRSMFDGIKTLSSQLKMNEEIFGETHDTSEESE